MTRAIMETSKGTINLNLFEKDAPNTVANFVKLSKEGFLRWSELSPGHSQLHDSRGMPSMASGTGGPGYKIKCEIN